MTPGVDVNTGEKITVNPVQSPEGRVSDTLKTPLRSFSRLMEGSG